MSDINPEDAVPPEVRQAIHTFLQAEASSPVRVSDALQAVRRVFPELDMSDQELTDAITSEAFNAGHEVETDR